MKIFNKIVFLLAAVLVLGLSSCEKKEGTGPLITTLGTGAYVTLNKTINTFLNYSDLSNTTVSIEVKEYGNPVEKVITYVSTNGSIDKSTWRPVGEFPIAGGVATLVVSAQSIASALGVQPADLSPGNSYTLFNEVITKDGESFSIANTNTDVEGNSNYKMALRWSASVICPFVAADAAGTYKVIRDDWDGSVGATVEATATANTLTLTYAFPAAANPGKAPITISIDAATGAATIAKQVYGSYGTGFENFACQGTGLVFSCAGKVNLRLQHLLGSSDYGTYPLNLQKQ